MGACCTGAEKIEDEIENCKSINELRQLLKNKYNEAEKEQKEINDYLEDKRKKPTLIEVDNLDSNMLQKRVPYLEEVKNCIVEIDGLLEKNPNLDLKKTKINLNELYNIYGWVYDDEKRYEKYLQSFRDFVNSSENK